MRYITKHFASYSEITRNNFCYTSALQKLFLVAFCQQNNGAKAENRQSYGLH